MRPEYDTYVQRLRTQLSDHRDYSKVPQWLQTHTRDPIDNRKQWSFVDHEYQPTILADTTQEISAQKCSQVGASELWVRLATALAAISRKITIIYLLPTSAMSKRFVRGRVDTLIDDSPTLKNMVDPNVDNQEMKKIRRSLIYFSGTVGSVSAISTPAQALFRDELDFCNQRVLTTFDSRLGHAAEDEWLKRSFSTPTVFQYGINLLFEKGSQAYYLVKCPHCHEWVAVNYFNDVEIPGFDGTARELEKEDLANPRTKLNEAFFRCALCRTPLPVQAFLDPANRRWVHKFPDRTKHHSYQIQPIDVPRINPLARTLGQLDDYASKKDWVNFKLGLPFEDGNSSFLEDQLRLHAICTPMSAPLVDDLTARASGCVMGMDVGKTSWITIAFPTTEGGMDVIYKERVRQDGDNHAGKRAQQLYKAFGCVMGVIDAGPDISLAQFFVAFGRGRNFACQYYQGSSKSRLRSLDLIQSRDDETGLVVVLRSGLFDELVRKTNSGFVRLNSALVEFELALTHLRSLKRIETKDDQTGESFVQWITTTGEDHYGHSLGYCYIARQLTGAPQAGLVVPYIPSVGVIKLKQG